MTMTTVVSAKRYTSLSLNCELAAESETKDGLKPICNDDCVVLGRSKAKNQNNEIVVTVRLQSFGTRLRGRRFNPFNGIDRRPF